MAIGLEHWTPSSEWVPISEAAVRALCGTDASYRGAIERLNEGRELTLAGVRVRKQVSVKEVRRG